MAANLDETPEELTEKYWQRGYSVVEITAALGVNGFYYSYRHVQRLLRKLGLKRRENESELDDILSAMQRELSSGTGQNLGIRPLQYKLQTKYGLIVTRQTVNDLLQIYTPEALESRRAGRLKRRAYQLTRPNHVWHCDGYDKLKPFGICLHGAIDGWSRKILWMRVGRTNNDPNVIAKYYMETVRESGIVPCIIRIDRGTENGHMADIHTLLREDHDDEFSSHPVFIGRSTSNQRIERWWGYLKMTYVRPCLELFKDMRDSGLPRSRDPVHRECIRFCFISLVQREINQVVETWNNHRIRNQISFCPSGKPSFMYSNSVIYGCRDPGLPIDLDSLEVCEELYNLEDFEMGSTDDFSELAFELMLENNWTLPETLEDAMNLFGNLIWILDQM